MTMNPFDRRSFLKSIGTAGAACAATGAAFGLDLHSGEGHIVHEVAEAPQDAGDKPKYTIKFAVCGFSHDHIHGMIGAVQRGGGILVGYFGAEHDKLATFKQRYPDAKMYVSEKEVLEDTSLQLVLTSTIPNERAPLGVRVMKSGKDFLSDKPGATTLEQIAAIRHTIAETKRIYAILYSERLEVKAAVKAGELVQAGAIGRVLQTINIAPHQIQQAGTGDNGGAGARPEWFWHPEQYGGILCDIGSHQVDQFLFYTGSKKAEIVESQIANVNHPHPPQVPDVGAKVRRRERGVG